MMIERVFTSAVGITGARSIGDILEGDTPAAGLSARNPYGPFRWNLGEIGLVLGKP